jgi:aminodeoxyfutalosine synthase
MPSLTPFQQKYLQSSELNPIAAKVFAGERLTLDDGRTLYATRDFTGLGMLANWKREQLNGDKAYFIVNRYINPTNVCTAGCTFCAFARVPGQEGGYTLELAQIRHKILHETPEECCEVHMVGGLNPEVPYSWYIDVIKAVKEANPRLHIKAYTMVELAFLAEHGNKPLIEVLQDLKEAGVGSYPGGGAEIFDHKVRDEVCAGKIDGKLWIDTARAVHNFGVRSTCTMLYGHVESRDDRLDHLDQLRRLQDETHGFDCFVPLAFHNKNTRYEFTIPPTTGDEDLRTYAVSRLMFDNIPHLHAHWITVGPALAQIALGFGVDDIGGTLVEETIHHEAGSETPQGMTKPELIHLILRAGRAPVQRDTLYHVIQAYGPDGSPVTGEKVA